MGLAGFCKHNYKPSSSIQTRTYQSEWLLTVQGRCTNHAFGSSNWNSLRAASMAQELKVRWTLSGVGAACGTKASWPGSATGRQSTKWTRHQPINYTPTHSIWALQRATRTTLLDPAYIHECHLCVYTKSFCSPFIGRTEMRIFVVYAHFIRMIQVRRRWDM
jgi:hypothetical protein